MSAVNLRAFILVLCVAASAQAQRESRPASAPKPPANAAPAAAEPDLSALGALNLLPKESAAQVARIAGPDGHPFPERWYVLTHDPAAPRGLREFVFSGGKLVAGRALSQFADSISGEDVIGATAIKVNSDQAAGIAAQFAMHNSQQLSGINYELAKQEAPAVPVWRLTCVGPAGQTLGTIELHATKGTVLGFQGFEKSPLPIDTAPEAMPVVAQGKEPARGTTAPKTEKKTAARSERPSSSPPPRAIPRPVVRERRDRVGGFFRRIFD